MGSDIWGALLLIMHFIGIAAAAYALMLRLLRQKKNEKCVWLVEARSAEQARDRLYAMHMRRTLLGESGRCVIVALDRGVADTDQKELLRFCASVPNMHCCKPEALPALLRETIKERQ